MHQAIARHGLSRLWSPYRNIGRACALVASSIGLLAVVGWITASPFLAGFSRDSLPMPLDAACAFLLLGGCLAVLSFSRRAAATWFVRGGAALVLFYVTLRLSELVIGQDLQSASHLLKSIPSAWESFGPLRMTLFTAVNIWFAAATLILLVASPVRREARSLRFMALTFAVTVVAMSLVFALGYVFGDPFFKGQAAIPMDFNSSLALLAMGGGLLLLMSPDVSPLRLMSGPSITARLLRAFLPFTLIMIALVAWLTHVLRGPEESSAGLITALLAVAAMFLAGFLCERIARVVSANLEEAEGKLRAAEQQSRNYASRLEILNASLEDRVADRTAALEQRNEALKNAQSQLVQSEKLAAIGQMVAGVAHEINNPLSFVGNNLAVLQRDVNHVRDLMALYQEAADALAAHRPEIFERVSALTERINLPYTLRNLDGLVLRSRDGVKRIQDIVKDLREFARLDESDLHDVDLNVGIETTLNIVRPRAKKHDVELVFEPASLPRVTCYPAKINQVVLNLVANAIDACATGGSVIVQTQAISEGVEIRVSDTGCGIEPALLKKIFDPFFTTKPSGQGTGLGLSISHQIVHEHGGAIEVESSPKAGTTFIVRLPLRPRNEGRRPWSRKEE